MERHDRLPPERKRHIKKKVNNFVDLGNELRKSVTRDIIVYLCGLCQCSFFFILAKISYNIKYKFCKAILKIQVLVMTAMTFLVWLFDRLMTCIVLRGNRRLHSSLTLSLSCGICLCRLYWHFIVSPSS